MYVGYVFWLESVLTQEPETTAWTALDHRVGHRRRRFKAHLTTNEYYFLNYIQPYDNKI